jgi:hypothetical protein
MPPLFHVHTQTHTYTLTHTQRDPEVAGALCGAQELTADFMFGDSLTMDKIIVYGSSLDAYQALSVREVRGEPYLAVVDTCAHAFFLHLLFLNPFTHARYARCTCTCT